MTIENTYAFIWLLLIPALWIFLYHPAIPFKRPKHKKRFGIMKSALVLMAVLAAAGIHKKQIMTISNIMFVRDVSLSCAAGDESRIQSFMHKIMDEAGKQDRFGLVAFGKQAYVEKELSQNFDIGPGQTLPDKTRTALGQAIQTAAGRMDPQGNNKIILMTDGNSNLTDPADAAGMAGALGIQIFPVPIGSWFDSNEVYLEKLAVPRQTALHTPFRIRAVISSTSRAEGEILIFKNDEIMVKKSVDLVPGKNSFAFDDVIADPGAVTYRAVVNAAPDTVFENNEFTATTTGFIESGILYLSRSDRSPTVRALQTQGMTVQIEPPSNLPRTLNRLLKYRAIIIDNIEATQFSFADMENIRSFVSEAGGGLLMLGGDHSFGAGHYLNTPIEKVLPVSMDHPTTLENPEFCLLLLIDTSSSMSGYAKNRSKLEGAKTASFSVVELLNPFDRIGLLGFDSEFYWVVPVTQASERHKIATELSNLTASGGTDLFPALSHAFETLENVNAQKKHIIVLSDGKTKEADFKGLIRAMTRKNITISTVAVGKTSDRKTMRKIAAWGKGRMYYTDDADNIPRIFTGDTRIASRKTIYEQRMDTKISELKPFLQGMLNNEIPWVDGMVKTYPKPNASIVLNTQNGPLLAVSRQGLGRSIAYTSAFDGKWGKDFVEWSQFEPFVSQMVKWVQKADPQSVYREQIRRLNDHTRFKVDVIDDTGRLVNHANLKLSLVLPSKQKLLIPLQQTAPGHYECGFETDQTGEYLMTLFEDTKAPTLPTRTFFMGIPYSDEYRTKGVNHKMLDKIAKISNGRVLDLDGDVSSVFRHKKEGPQTGRGMWPWFVIAFAIVFVLDVGMRKLQELNETRAGLG